MNTGKEKQGSHCQFKPAWVRAEAPEDRMLNRICGYEGTQTLPVHPGRCHREIWGGIRWNKYPDLSLYQPSALLDTSHWLNLIGSHMARGTRWYASFTKISFLRHRDHREWKWEKGHQMKTSMQAKKDLLNMVRVETFFFCPSRLFSWSKNYQCKTD